MLNESTKYVSDAEALEFLRNFDLGGFGSEIVVSTKSSADGNLSISKITLQNKDSSLGSLEISAGARGVFTFAIIIKEKLN